MPVIDHYKSFVITDPPPCSMIFTSPQVNEAPPRELLNVTLITTYADAPVPTTVAVIGAWVAEFVSSTNTEDAVTAT